MNPRSLRRAALRLGAVLMFLILAGATYQGVTTALERRAFPRPGGMVDVGGHQLHVHCVGEGSPTVVLEAPAAGMSAAWGWVEPQIARVTRVCSYDRAGLGWSERSDRAYEPPAATGELHTLLERAGQRPPFVLVGHGLGAAFAKLFASRYDAETSALILVDYPAPAAPPVEPGALVRWPSALPWLARTGLLRASGALCAMTERLPAPAGGALCAFLNRPDHLSRTADELSRWTDTTSLAMKAQVRPAIGVTHLDIHGRDRVAFLSEPESASVLAAILDAVRHARNADAPADDGATPAAR